MKLNILFTKLVIFSFFLGFSNTNSNFETNLVISSESEAYTHLGLVTIKINNSQNNFKTDIYFNTNASKGLDLGYDASLLNGIAPPFSIYSLLVEQSIGTPMGIQSLGENELGDVIVPLGINALKGQNIVISITEMSIPESIFVYLEDKETHTFTLLNNDNYTFNAASDMTDVERFSLHFRSGILNTQKEALNLLNISVDKNENLINIEGQLYPKTKYQLYDIGGHLIDSNTLIFNNLKSFIAISNLSDGIYILRLSNYKYEYVQKLIIN